MAFFFPRIYVPTKAKKKMYIESSESFMTVIISNGNLTEQTYAEKVVVIIASDQFQARKRKGVAVTLCAR